MPARRAPSCLTQEVIDKMTLAWTIENGLTKRKLLQDYYVFLGNFDGKVRNSFSPLEILKLGVHKHCL